MYGVKITIPHTHPTDIAFPIVVFFSIAIPHAARAVKMDNIKLLLLCKDATTLAEADVIARYVSALLALW